MESYRLYFIDDEGRFASVVDLLADDDEGAVAAVAVHADGRAMELWQRGRKVKMFDAAP
jgi:hypothetical protein